VPATLGKAYERPDIGLARDGLTYRAAADLVGRFVARGLLEDITGQARNRLFRYSPYIEIFE
jgi:hypothetical protein